MKASLLMVLALSVAGCGSSDSAGPPNLDPLVGNYTLQTVGGESLPAIVSQTADQTTSVTGGVMTLAGQGSFTLRFTIYRAGPGGQTSSQVIGVLGNWVTTQNGAVIFQNVSVNGFNDPDAVTVTRVNNGLVLRSLVFTEAGGDFFYTKSS